jgi:hypothetical protein
MVLFAAVRLTARPIWSPSSVVIGENSASWTIHPGCSKHGLVMLDDDVRAGVTLQGGPADPVGMMVSGG